MLAFVVLLEAGTLGAYVMPRIVCYMFGESVEDSFHFDGVGVTETRGVGERVRWIFVSK